MSSDDGIAAAAAGLEADVAIVGASLAGSCAALLLARGGLRVAVLERARFPRPRICGELLSPDGVAVLGRLGVLPAVRAAGAATIRRFTVVGPSGSRVESTLPAPALSLSRERLDELLARAAADAGARVAFDAPVVGVDGSLSDGFVVRTPGSTLRARAVLGAWGRYSPLDGRLGRPFFRARASLFGFKKFLRGPAAHLEDRAILHLFRGGYLGLSLVEKGRVSLGALATPAVAQEAHHAFDSLLGRLTAESPALARDLRGLVPEPGPTLLSEPVHLGRRDPCAGDVLLAGDAAGVVDPYTGAGMALALRSGEAAAALLREYLAGELPATGVTAAWRRRHRRLAGRQLFFSRLLRPFFLGGAASRLLVPAAAPLARLAAVVTRGPV